MNSPIAVRSWTAPALWRLRLGIHSVAFSPDHRRLVTGGGGGCEAVKLWDLVTSREMLTLTGDGSVFNSVAFSLDGHWLMARSSVEGRVHLWRALSSGEIEAAEKRSGETSR